jgi:hypothetical protein
MLKYKNYVKILLLILLLIFGGAFFYVYIYAKSYPIPLFHRVSLDAKMKFVRDMEDRDRIDTIIVGSSIGLNNLQGAVLEDSSEKIRHVINLSALGLTTTQVEPLLKLLSLFPNTKRVIYSAQFEDWLGAFSLEDKEINFAKTYIELGKNNIDLTYTFYTYKHFIEFAKRCWEWEKKYAHNTTNHGLLFDHTGSVPLDMYGEHINQKMISKPPVGTQLDNEKNAISLDRIIKNIRSKGLQFYFVAEPYRQYMIDHNTDIRMMREQFIQEAKQITLSNHGKFIDLQKKLRLGDEYFVDREHVNSKGSALTAKAVAAFIDASE